MKYFKHSLIFLLLLGFGTKIQAQELTKKIHKEIEVSKDAFIEIAMFKICVSTQTC